MALWEQNNKDSVNIVLYLFLMMFIIQKNIIQKKN